MIVIGGCFYFLIMFCQCQDILDSDGYSNDSPYPVQLNIHNIRIKMGTPLTLKCINYQNQKDIIWEYKQCESSYKGIICDMENVANSNSTSWILLYPRRERIEIPFSNKTHEGLYRCKENDTVKRTFTVDVVGSANYEGLPPSVSSLKISNISTQFNMEFTIQCNVTSIVPPTIIWFKKCYGFKCEIDYDNTCYCHLNLSTSKYNSGNNYISKINIFNAHFIDSGVYACLAVTEYGKDYKNVTVLVPKNNSKEDNNWFPLLFIIPLVLIILPLLAWLCYRTKRKKKETKDSKDQRKKLFTVNTNS